MDDDQDGRHQTDLAVRLATRKKANLCVVALALSGLGAAWISGCSDGTTDPATPDPPRPTTVVVSPATADLTAIGATVQLQAEVRDQNGQLMAGTAVNWASNSTAVASVDASGLVSATGNGTAAVTATAGSASGTATVTVAQEVSAVTVSPAADTLVHGDTLRLSAEALDANGHPVATAAFTWTSSDTSVIVVDASGLVTGTDAGGAVVTASSSGASGSAELVVVAAVPTRVVVSPDSVALAAFGDTVRFVAEVHDQVGRVMKSAEVAWASSDTRIATVDAKGLMTAIGNGTATVTATAEAVSGSAAVSVSQRVRTVAVRPAADTLVHGDTLRLSAEARDANGHAVGSVVFTWLSSDTAVAVVDASGLVVGTGVGEAQVTATASGVVGRAEIVVAAALPTRVIVSPDSVALTALGDTVRFMAEVRDQLGRPKTGEEVAWASGDTLVATVDASGLVKATGNGLARITATVGAASGHATVAVVQRARTVTVLVAADTLMRGDTLRLAAEARDANGHAVDGAVFSWTSSDTSVATVDASGLVTGVGVGEATITAATDGASASTTMSVVHNVATVTLSPLSDTIAPGDTVRLTARAFNDEGQPVESVEFSWTSSDPSIATVDDDGLVLGVAEGSITVTATARDVEGTTAITVENPDRAALVALYNATDGPNWVNNENWLTDAPLGEWYGVDTNSSGRVVRLNLSGKWDSDTREYVSHGLAGPIPPEVGNLSKAELLRLVANDLNGSIPPELGELRELRVLQLYHNQLSGLIPPALGSLANLEWLDLQWNDLSGAIPPELGNLPKLRTLYLHRNNLSGLIPGELGELHALQVLHLGGNRLWGPIPPELGGLASLERLRLPSNELSGPIPKALGELPKLRDLYLVGNQLSGPIPPELGRLANLEALNVAANALSGPIPTTLLDIAGLRFLIFEANSGLCAPGIAAFVEWLDGIEDHRGPFCNESDRASLESLFEAAGGSGWTNQNGWLADNALAGWHGVRTNSLGRVTGLDLTDNGLVGRLPATFGELRRMTEVRIGGNAGLEGRLPLSLAKLSLRVLHYPGTGLCAPADTSFRKWLNAIPSHDGTASECPPLSDREALEALYDATGGPNWNNSRYWMTDAPLRRWHGVSVGAQGRVIGLELRENNLTGSIPPELGSLANLQTLILADNSLSGPIPPELGNLANLKELGLWRWVSSQDSLTGPIPPELGNLVELEDLNLRGHGLSGSIPPELGNLANLRWLSLEGNDLSGPIPSELGHLANIHGIWLDGNRLSGPIPSHLGKPDNLLRLSLGDNDLSGPIPRQLGNLRNLESLHLQDNDLSGPIPSDLGDLTTLYWLHLDHNGLTGPIPPEFGGLTRLIGLGLSGNAGLSGPLPAALTDLKALEALQAGGTDLCVPPGPRFRDWIEKIHNRRIALCSGGGGALAYLTQAVQSREYPVPLVAGEEALLRVFVTAAVPTTEGLPAVRARFFVGGTERHVASIPAGATPIPTEVGEDALSSSVNAEVPGAVVRPGLEVVVEIDPEGTLDPGLGVPKRIPETGRMALDVRQMPVLGLTVVPFLWRADPDSAIVELTAEMAADPQGHELLADTRTLLPVAGVAVKEHAPVWSSSNSAFDLIGETEAIRVLEGGDGHWMGMMSGRVTGAGGVAYVAGRTNFSQPNSRIIAHELGHNMNLWHAPCGGAGGPDPSFPYRDGSIGSWGYDFAAGGGQVHPSTPDIMSYCAPAWISDYHFTNALRYRLFDEGASAADSGARSAESLLLWGGTDTEGEPFLNPAFVVDAPATLPDSAGEYRLVGHSANGTELFALDFPMAEVADGDGRLSFAFAVPVRPGWADQLATITLAGPGGTATLDRDTDRPMTILRDPATGQVRGILRDPPVAGAQPEAWGAIVPDARLEVLYSRGIPDATAR